jgi:hypothetical protein
LFLERKAERCAAVLTAIVAAPPGGVLVHCVGGRDRTGLIVLLVLAAVGAAPQDIVADYELSNVRLPELWSARGEPDQRLRIAAIFARRQTTAGALLLELLDGLDVSGLLGADAAESLRRRLVAPPSLLRFVSGK